MSWLYQIPILIFSIILHEYAHGRVAEMRGDDTARVMGRLTFNPLPHIDIVGSIILPLFSAIAGGPMIGWAKPVPINPYRLNNPVRDMMLVGAAGPLSNFLFAVACAFVLYFLRLIGFYDDIIFAFLKYAVVINILLPVFNLVPIPPLDGSRIVAGILPPQLAYRYMRIEPYGIFIIFILISSNFFWRIILGVVYFIAGALLGGWRMYV